MAPKIIDMKLCNSCGICVRDCPTEVFAIDGTTGKANIAYPDDCAECKLCSMWPNLICPAGAIKSSPNMADKVFFPYDIEHFPAKGPVISKETGQTGKRN